MRQSEITPELIELSKKAKELGFPQDVEEGDWIYAEGVHLVTSSDAKGFGILILSFSRCLEWLVEKEYFISTEPTGPPRDEFVVYYQKGITCREDAFEHICAKTHHEAIAKVVVKILEEE